MVGGRGVCLERTSQGMEPEFFVCVDLGAGRRGERTEGKVWLASGVERAWLDEAHITRQIEVDFDASRGQAVALERTRYLDLLLDERPTALPTDGRAAEALEGAAKKQLERALALDDAATAQWLARVRCLREWMPALELPRLERGDIEAALPALCMGRCSFAELKKAPLIEILSASFTRQQHRSLAQHAPTHVEIPTGRRAQLFYEEGRPPRLSVRIQEMFGLRETPSVAGGRVAVLLHLLAPNQRPQQITQDLPGFWERTYPEVRKELRARYPKHPWPEDPLNAPPTGRSKHRRR